jgi:hypothetical protein
VTIPLSLGGSIPRHLSTRGLVYGLLKEELRAFSQDMAVRLDKPTPIMECLPYFAVNKRLFHLQSFYLIGNSFFALC